MKLKLTLLLVAIIVTLLGFPVLRACSTNSIADQNLISDPTSTPVLTKLIYSYQIALDKKEIKVESLKDDFIVSIGKEVFHPVESKNIKSGKITFNRLPNDVFQIEYNKEKALIYVQSGPYDEEYNVRKETYQKMYGNTYHVCSKYQKGKSVHYSLYETILSSRKVKLFYLIEKSFKEVE